MPLVKNGAPAEDIFTAVADDAALPDGPVLVSAERFLKEADTLVARNDEIGVLWPNARDVAELKPYLSRLSVVALTFPKFRDGRAYSQARLLRERYGFKGELRAVGNVLRDQALMMARAGFDAFAFEKAADADAFNKALATYSHFYQPTGDGRATARDVRVAHPGPAPVEG
ncbi:uncharacterized protein (DUF934 family) [Xanthobacter flavus]|uniref:Oxidoreductase n=1 Tax=Xanthobacter flavus TaxID=281 RepID=A0A9W6CMZ2_XANFL|nr:DUF934 domain-containing protein [Xanthobacter flavus]MDR6336404.1 uncharacterized protein (DUF934 family) [Xanthobacter flavus]GLI25378.1 oxidoreductase [Xanthobacter flavus]